MLVKRIDALKQAMKMEQDGKAYYEKADKLDGVNMPAKDSFNLRVLLDD